MAKKTKGIIILVIILLFCGASILPSISGYSYEIEESEYLLSEKELSSINNNEQYNSITQNIERLAILNDIWLEQDKIIASDGEFADYFGMSVSISGDYAIIGAVLDDDNGLSSGSAYIFRRENTIWVQEAKINASDGIGGERFGYSVSIDANYAVIGAVLDDDNGASSGSAYVFRRDGTVWTEEAKLLASDGFDGDYFGISVSIDGSYTIIGARYDDDKGTDSGSAYVFKRDGTVWTEEAKLLASDGADYDYFGSSVSIDGDYAIIGAYLDDDLGFNCGSAYVFRRDGTVWTEEAKLLASDGSGIDNFGYGVSICDDYALVGSPCDDDNGFDSGSAYVFKHDGTVWTEEAKLLASDGLDEDNFGYIVSISNDYALVGAPYDDDNGEDSGSAYVFKRDDTMWVDQTKIIASDVFDSDNYAMSVSIDDDYIIIGSPGDDDNGGSSGSAYVFNKIELESDLDCSGSLSWSDITPGETVTGSFDVSNIGDSNSELSWEVIEWPDWGTWTFTPNNGTGLTPENGTLTVFVEVVAPNQQNTEFDGVITVVNVDNSSDYDEIDVYLATPVSIPSIYKIPIVVWFLKLLPFNFFIFLNMINQ